MKEGVRKGEGEGRGKGEGGGGKAGGSRGGGEEKRKCREWQGSWEEGSRREEAGSLEGQSRSTRRRPLVRGKPPRHCRGRWDACTGCTCPPTVTKPLLGAQ